MFPTLASLSLWKLPIFLGLWTQGSSLCPWGHSIFCSVYVCVSLLCLPLIKWKRKSFSCVWLFVTPRNSPGQNTGVGSSSLLQGIYPIQGSNPGLPNCRQILYQLSHQGSATTETQSVFTPITSVPNPNRFNKYFWLNIPNLLARQSGKIAQVGFKVLIAHCVNVLWLL